MRANAAGKKNHLLLFLARKLGWCVHPAESIEVFHWSAASRHYDGINRPLACGHICVLCMGKVDLPGCRKSYCLDAIEREPS